MPLWEGIRGFTKLCALRLFAPLRQNRIAGRYSIPHTPIHFSAQAMTSGVVTQLTSVVASTHCTAVAG